jgi:6-pyruvoyltetrahydropterin/6-carboxytetrahydropterin synthase
MLGSLGMKMAVLPFESTSENLCRAALAHIKTVASEELRRRGITEITIRLSETETCFAELTESV